MSNHLPHIIPALPPQAEDVLAAAQITREYYAEVRSRNEFAQYCQWYHATAAANRHDLQKMRSELNIFAWFRR